MKNFKQAIKASILSLLMVIGYSSFGQDGENKLGIKGGINFSNFHSTNDDVDDQNLRIGFQGGLFYKLALTDFLAIQPELLYTTKGASFDYDQGAFGDGEITQRFGYIEMPLLAVLNLGESFSIHAGPYVAYMLNAKVENESDVDVFDFSNELDTDEFERFEYGLAIGAGFEYDKLMFGARFDYGLSEVGKEQKFSFNGSEASSDLFKNEKNAVLSIFLGLNF